METIDKLKLYSPIHHKFKVDIALLLLTLYYVVVLTFLPFSKELQEYITEGYTLFLLSIGIVILINAKVIDLYNYLITMKEEMDYDIWVKYKENPTYKFIKKIFVPHVIFNILLFFLYIFLIFATDNIMNKIIFFIVSIMSIVISGILIYNNYLKIK